MYKQITLMRSKKLDMKVMKSHRLVNLLVPKPLILKTILQRLRVKVPYFCHPDYLHVNRFQNVLWIYRYMTFIYT